MHRPLRYQEFPGRLDLLDAHGLALGTELPDALLQERVDQPGLPPGELVDQGQSLVTEVLPRLFGMLSHQGTDILRGKGTQGDGILLDVEGAAWPELDSVLAAN